MKMKKIFGIIFLAAVISACSNLNKEMKTSVSKNETDIETAAAKKPESSLTLEKFNLLQNGMKYTEAAKILGGKGVETSSFSSDSVKTVTYKWEGEKYARITAVFKNGELSSKIQTGLKIENPTARADLTLDKYNRIENGMTYEEAVKIIGSEGIQTGSSIEGKEKITSYKWEGEEREKIFATFRNEKLSSKSQMNLK